MSSFLLNGTMYTIFQGKTTAPSNDAGAFGNYDTASNYVGDHLDAFYRYDGGGTYDRVPNFFAFPANASLTTLADSSVAQSPSETLPAEYQSHPYSNGTDWQVGSAFAAYVAPRLSTDPAGSQRIIAFFAAESFPADQGIGGHLIGFASVVVPSGGHSVPPMWSGRWKDPSSQNDGEYKLQQQLPLRTLYLQNFTPVLAFRGDTGIRGEDADHTSIGAMRHASGMTGWYRNGYHYLLIETLLAESLSDWCTWDPVLQRATWQTRRSRGYALFRFRADLTGAAPNFGGLYLDSLKRPQVEIYKPATRTFVALPHPENILSFADDGRPNGGEYPSGCALANRQAFTGCCNNPAFNASEARIAYPGTTSGVSYSPSSTFTWGDPCTRYISVFQDESTFRLLRLRENTASCGTGEPQYTFEDGATINHTAPAGWGRAEFYGGWPAVQPMEGSANTLLGYRFVQNVDTGAMGEASFTVAPQLHYTVYPPSSPVAATTPTAFKITDLNGGELVSGDTVTLDEPFASGENSVATRRTFVIEKREGSGVIAPTDPIVLLDEAGGYIQNVSLNGRISSGRMTTFSLAPRE